MTNVFLELNLVALLLSVHALCVTRVLQIFGVPAFMRCVTDCAHPILLCMVAILP